MDQLCVQPDTLSVNPRPTEECVVLALAFALALHLFFLPMAFPSSCLVLQSFTCARLRLTLASLGRSRSVSPHLPPALRARHREISQLQQRIETAVGDIVRKGHFATYNPRRPAEVFKNLLPDLEAEKLGLPADDDDEENMIALNALNDEYAVMGCPQHFTFVDLDDLLAQLSASGIFEHEVDNFVNKVLVVGYCNCICSVWVYAAALSSASRRSSY